MKYDVIVIGSGLGGLECANLLARKGRSVLVLERQQQAGGCLQSYHRRGAVFDTGMHYVGGLGEGECLYESFKCLGLMELPWQRLDPTGFDRVTIGEKTYRFAQGHDAFVETLSQDFPHERAALRRYCEVMNEAGNHLSDMFKPKDATDFFASSLFAKSAYGFLQETFSDPLLINVLGGTSLKMELRKDTLPLFNFAEVNHSFVQSSWRLRGDGNLLVAKLVEKLNAYGGELICGAEVSELIERDGLLVAARCANGEVYEADVFISDAHPAVTCGLVKESAKMKKVYRNRIQRLDNTFGMFTVSLKLKTGSLEYFNHNKYVYKNANVWDFYENTCGVGGVLISCPVPPPTSTHAQSLDLLTPMLWHEVEKWAETSVGHRGAEYLDFKERKAEECIKLAERVLPGLSSMIEAKYTSTPLTYRDYNLSPQGTAYGIRKDFGSPMMTLLSPKTPIPNLFLTGQSLTLHGLLGVTMSSLMTVTHID